MVVLKEVFVAVQSEQKTAIEQVGAKGFFWVAAMVGWLGKN